MLNLLMKGLIVAGAAGIVAGIAYVSSKNKKEYAEVSDKDFEETEDIEEPETVKEKILAKVIKLVDWITANQERIGAVSTVISLAAGCFELRNFIRDSSSLVAKKKGYYILLKDDNGNEYLANYVRRLS